MKQCFNDTLCVIGIEGGNDERQELSRRGKFRAQVNVLPVAKLFHGFAKGDIGLELGQVGTPKFGQKFLKNWGMGLGPPILELKQGLRPPIAWWQIPPPPKTPWGSRYWGSKFELWSRFSQNW